MAAAAGRSFSTNAFCRSCASGWPGTGSRMRGRRGRRSSTAPRRRRRLGDVGHRRRGGPGADPRRRPLRVHRWPWPTRRAWSAPGPALLAIAKAAGGRVIPVDSEHSAVFQVFETANADRCLPGHSDRVRADPFRTWTDGDHARGDAGLRPWRIPTGTWGRRSASIRPR